MESVIAKAKAPAIVVAHPDDEALFAAGAIIRYPKDWVIVCCTIPHRDPERRFNFKRSCKVLGASHYQLPHHERAGPIPIDQLEYILEDRDLIITHGSRGEYGHVQHKEVHKSLRAKYQDRLVWFSYGDPETSFTISLTDDEWAKKLEAIKCYDNWHDQTQKTYERLLDYFGKHYPLRKEPYALTTECLNRFNV